MLKIAAETGGFTGTMDSLDQGAADLPIASIQQDAGTVKIRMDDIGAAFDGALRDNASTLSGNWTQGGKAWPLEFKRIDEVPKLARPQEPKKPYPYHEEQVKCENRADKITLAGTLTLPTGKPPFAAVLLISGSGPQDRDETVMGHRPFLVLADYLTRQGIAVLRLDDRGVGISGGKFETATSVDFARDALAAVQYLKARPEINPKKIGLIGHSEGGLVAPMVAIQSSDVAYIVLMAGPGLKGEQILYMQAALMANAAGVRRVTIGLNHAVQEIIFRTLKEEKNDAAAIEKLRAFVPGDGQVKEAALKSMVSPWFRYFIDYDPRPALTKVKVPVLALIGEKDLQVPPTENLAAIADALKSGGNKDYKAIELARLNHLFQTSRTGSPSEYSQIEETISPVALKAISEWILAHTKS